MRDLQAETCKRLARNLQWATGEWGKLGEHPAAQGLASSQSSEAARQHGENLMTKRGRACQVMNEEILPACERLRREKGQYMEWQAANANADRLRRFCVAYRYVEAQRCGADPMTAFHESLS